MLQDFSNLESGSETGLNCPINDEDMLQINHGKTNPALNNNSSRTTNVDDFDDDEIASNGEISQVNFVYSKFRCVFISVLLVENPENR